MKITKTAEQESSRKRKRAIANFGCDSCPCCGESKKMEYYIKRGISDKGILIGISKNCTEGFWRPKHYTVDCYHCITCGAEWESEPYEG